MARCSRAVATPSPRGNLPGHITLASVARRGTARPGKLPYSRPDHGGFSATTDPTSYSAMTMYMTDDWPSRTTIASGMVPAFLYRRETLTGNARPQRPMDVTDCAPLSCRVSQRMSDIGMRAVVSMASDDGDVIDILTRRTRQFIERNMKKAESGNCPAQPMTCESSFWFFTGGNKSFTHRAARMQLLMAPCQLSPATFSSNHLHIKTIPDNTHRPMAMFAGRDGLRPRWPIAGPGRAEGEIHRAGAAAQGGHVRIQTKLFSRHRQRTHEFTPSNPPWAAAPDFSTRPLRWRTMQDGGLDEGALDALWRLVLHRKPMARPIFTVAGSNEAI